MANHSDRAKKWAEIVARAWMDETFKQKLMQNPKKVLEDNQNQHFLILPEKPKGKFSETELKSIAGGWIQCPSYASGI